MYAQIVDGNIVGQWDSKPFAFGNTFIMDETPDDQLVGFGVFPVTLSNTPNYDGKHVNTLALSVVDGLPVGTYTITDVPAPPLPSVAQMQTRMATAYNNYLNNQLNSLGVAIVLAGIMAQKPKCIATKTYLNALTVDYAARVAAIDGAFVPNYDFSNNGDKPYSWAELQEEVGM